MQLTKAEIFAGVQKVLIDTLAVDELEVTPEVGIMTDLAAESIDFLDVMFLLESAFDIKIERQELFPEDILVCSEYVESPSHRQHSLISYTFEQPPILKETAVAVLKERLPWRDPEVFQARKPFPVDITVAELCRFVEWKLQAN